MPINFILPVLLSDLLITVYHINYVYKVQSNYRTTAGNCQVTIYIIYFNKSMIV